MPSTPFWSAQEGTKSNVKENSVPFAPDAPQYVTANCLDHAEIKVCSFSLSEDSAVSASHQTTRKESGSSR